MAAPNRWLVVAEGSDHDIPAECPDAIVDAAVRILGESFFPDQTVETSVWRRTARWRRRSPVRSAAPSPTASAT